MSQKSRFIREKVDWILIIGLTATMVPAILISELSLYYKYYIGVLTFILPGYTVTKVLLFGQLELEVVEITTISIIISLLTTGLFVFVLSIVSLVQIWALTLLHTLLIAISIVVSFIKTSAFK